MVEIKGVAINPNVEYRTTRHRFRIQLHMKSMVNKIVKDPPMIPMFNFEEFNDIKAAPANFKDFNIGKSFTLNIFLK